MRCQKCGFISFDQQTSCVKCGVDQTANPLGYEGTGQKLETPFFLAVALGEAEAMVSPETLAVEAEEDVAEVARQDGSNALFDELEAESHGVMSADEGGELDLSFVGAGEDDADEEISLELPEDEEEISLELPEEEEEISLELPEEEEEISLELPEEEEEISLELPEEEGEISLELPEEEEEVSLELPEEEEELALSMSEDVSAEEPEVGAEEVEESPIEEQAAPEEESLGLSMEMEGDESSAAEAGEEADVEPDEPEAAPQTPEVSGISLEMSSGDEDAEDQGREDAEDQGREDAEDQGREDAEDQGREDAEDRGREDAEDQGREDAEDQGREDAEGQDVSASGLDLEEIDLSDLISDSSAPSSKKIENDDDEEIFDLSSLMGD